MYSAVYEPSPENAELPLMVHMAPGWAVQFLKLATTPPPPRMSNAARPVVAPLDEEDEEVEEEKDMLVVEEDVTMSTSSIFVPHELVIPPSFAMDGSSVT